MIVVMRKGFQSEDLQAVLARARQSGLSGHVSDGVERTVVGLVGVSGQLTELKEELELMPGVEEVVRITKPYKLSAREFHPESTVVEVGEARIGGDDVVVIAGPCAVETEAQAMDTARAVKAAGASLLRGGAFKPSTSPYSFRGLGEEGLKLLAACREETGLPFVTEILTVRDIDLLVEYADVLQVGARNMQNFALLDEVGKVSKPVLLKRGMSATIEEWLLAAEYILEKGNRQVILCERGIRTYESYTRNTMDVSAIPAIHGLSHLPIIADPSHGTGKRSLVTPVALASVAAGADGLMIEVHPKPDSALKDGAQSLAFGDFETLMKVLDPVAAAVGRKVSGKVRS
jgi:3-deoxy-7-phosphoheptulonate synthase